MNNVAKDEKDQEVNNWINQGNSDYSLGRFKKAIKSFDKAIKINPKNEEALYNR